MQRYTENHSVRLTKEISRLVKRFAAADKLRPIEYMRDAIEDRVKRDARKAKR